MPSDVNKGIYPKFHVERVDERDQEGGDRADARYFVLDYVHDYAAREALRTYAGFVLGLGFEKLFEDIMDALDEVEDKYGRHTW